MRTARATVTLVTALLAVAGRMQPAIATSQFDGKYVGDVAVVGAGDSNCYFYKAARVRIRADRIDRQVINGTRMSAAINPNGTFSAEGWKQMQRGRVHVTFSGSVQNGILDAAVATQYCRWHLVLHRQ